jgi:hypothetical protein
MQEFPGFDANDIQDISAIIIEQMRDEERLEDALAGAAYLAQRRATLMDRPHSPTRTDIEFALSIWTWWPFKPHPAHAVESILLQLRPRAFFGASSGDFTELDAFVPDETLRMSLEDLYAAQQEDVRAFLRPEGGETRSKSGSSGSGSQGGPPSTPAPPVVKVYEPAQIGTLEEEWTRPLVHP